MTSFSRKPQELNNQHPFLLFVKNRLQFAGACFFAKIATCPFLVTLLTQISNLHPRLDSPILELRGQRHSLLHILH